jgi:hypothetical protein
VGRRRARHRVGLARLDAGIFAFLEIASTLWVSHVDTDGEEVWWPTLLALAADNPASREHMVNLWSLTLTWRGIDMFLAWRVWVQRLLGWASGPGGGGGLAAPVLRRPGGRAAAVPAGALARRSGATLAALVVAVLAVPVMAALLAIATPFRLLRRNPPSLVLGVDDMVVSAATTTMGGVKRVAGAAGPVSRAHFLIVPALGVVLMWRWNASYCPDGDAACSPPVAVWADVAGIDDDSQPVAPAPSETPTDPLVPPPGS